MCSTNPGSGKYNQVILENGEMYYKSSSTGMLYETPPSMSFAILTDFRILEQLDECGLEMICSYTGLSVSSANSIWFRPKNVGGNVDDRIYLKLIELRNKIFKQIGIKRVIELRDRYNTRKNLYGFQKTQKTLDYMRLAKEERKTTVVGQEESYNRPNNNGNRVTLTLREQHNLLHCIATYGSKEISKRTGYSPSAIRKMKKSIVLGHVKRSYDAEKGLALKEYLNS